MDSENIQLETPPNSPSSEPVGNQVDPVQPAPQGDPQAEFGDSRPEYIQPDQINAVATNAVKAGGKAWLWYTIAGVITTLVILLGGAYWFFYVKDGQKTVNTNTAATSSSVYKDDQGEVVTLPEGLPLYPGSISGVNKVGSFIVLTITTTDPIDKISQFYEALPNSYGWILASTTPPVWALERKVGNDYTWSGLVSLKEVDGKNQLSYRFRVGGL